VWGGAGTTLSALLGYAFTFDLMLGLASLSVTGYLTGGIKPEAFERCNEVPEPPVNRCRLRVP